LGGAWDRVNWADVSLTGEPAAFRSTSIAGGGHLGLNWQAGSIVLGLEAAITAMRLRDTITSVVNPVVTYTNQIDWIATVVGKLGFSTGPGLIYVTGGYAAARLITSGNNPGLPDSFNISAWRSGWTIGGGYDHLFAGNWIFGVDYKYIDLGTHNRAGTTVLAIPFVITGIDARVHLLMARLSVKFGSM
jgi:outer membrane immunogenic protein